MDWPTSAGITALICLWEDDSKHCLGWAQPNCFGGIYLAGRHCAQSASENLRQIGRGENGHHKYGARDVGKVAGLIYEKTQE